MEALDRPRPQATRVAISTRDKLHAWNMNNLSLASVNVGSIYLSIYLCLLYSYLFKHLLTSPVYFFFSGYSTIHISCSGHIPGVTFSPLTPDHFQLSQCSSVKKWINVWVKHMGCQICLIKSHSAG